MSINYLFMIPTLGSDAILCISKNSHTNLYGELGQECLDN